MIAGTVVGGVMEEGANKMSNLFRSRLKELAGFRAKGNVLHWGHHWRSDWRRWIIGAVIGDDVLY
jgi:hypothetical protein